MRWALFVIAIGACQQKTAPGEGSGSGSATVPRPPAIDAAAAAIGCDLSGMYRLRYRSNNANGWWLRFVVEHDALRVVSDSGMLGLDAAKPKVTLDGKACAITIAAKTKQAGDLEIKLAVADANVAGTIARTDKYEEKIAPIAGLRETSPQNYPSCMKPGVYQIHVTNVKRWALSGHPRFGGCKEMGDDKTAFVRLELLGPDILVDEAERDDAHGQLFGRADVRKTNECEFTISLEVQDFKLHEAKMSFNGDTVTGTTPDFTFDFMEDGEAGENMWSCHAKHADVVWKRVAD